MRDPQSRGSSWGGQGVNPWVLGMVLTAPRGDANGKLFQIKNSSFKLSPVPLSPSLEPSCCFTGPSTRTAGTGEARGYPWHKGGGLCAPHKAALEHSAPRSPPLLHPCPTGRGLLRVWAQPPQAGAARPPLGTIGGCPSAVGSTWGGGSPVPSRPAGCCRPSFAPAEDGFLARVLLAYAQPDEQPCLLVLLLLLDGPLRFILQLPPSLRARCRLQAQLLFDHLPQEGEWDQDDAEQDTGKGGRL